MDRQRLPCPPDGTFAATLSVAERKLAARLEGFGDIVFGFAVSQCALQLPTAHGHVDLAHPTAVLLYFGTFASLAALWLTYHRLMSGPYRPAGIDLRIAFAYLAFVSLLPYAMYTLTHEQETFSSTRVAIAEYATLFAILMLFAATITLRNLRRGWWMADAAERDLMWKALLRRCVVCVLMLLAVLTDLSVGPTATAVPFLGIYPAIRLVHMRFGNAPPPALLRIRSPQTAPAS